MIRLFTLLRDNSPRGLRRRADRLRIYALRLSLKGRALSKRADRLDAQADAAERDGDPDQPQAP